MQAAKIVYKPVGIATVVLGRVLAGVLFKQVWKWLSRDEDAPDATDEYRTWREVLSAAVLQGTIFAVVKAAAKRGGATAARRLTGAWPA